MVVRFDSVSEGFIYAPNLTLSTISDVDINVGRYFQVKTLQGNQTFISPAVRFLSPLSNANGRNIIINPGINKNNEIVSNITFLDSSTNNYIDVYKNQYNFHGAPITVSSIGTSLSTLCQLPNKSGTVALTTDIKPVYLLTLYWASKKTQTIPDITANMYVSYLASGLSLGSNTFVGSQLSQAVTNILLGDYFSAKNPSLKIVASGCSIYNDNINICEYITYYDNAGTDMLVANLTRNSTSGKINLGDVTSFSTLNIYVTQLS